MGSGCEDLVGTSIAGYSLVERIGRGATGAVYRATKDDREVAFKVLDPALASLDVLRRRFLREARALTKLEHPNIVAIDDFGVVDDYAYIAMELLTGETLEDALETGPLPIERVFRVMTEILAGLAFAHAHGVVHRDLKPANVFLPTGGPVRVLDFGLAKFLSTDELSGEGTLTRRGRVVGTPAYMAPEQISGAAVDARVDVYAAGTVLYELLADRRPFPQTRRSELLRAHLFAPVPPLAKVRPGLVVDEELETVVRRALAKDPAERFADAGAMLEALRAFGPASVSVEEPSPRPRRRSSAVSRSAVFSGEECLRAAREGSDAQEHTGASGASAPAMESATEPASAPSRGLTVAVWVAGTVALAGLYALGAYATTLR